MKISFYNIFFCIIFLLIVFLLYSYNDVNMYDQNNKRVYLSELANYSEEAMSEVNRYNKIIDDVILMDHPAIVNKFMKKREVCAYMYYLFI